AQSFGAPALRQPAAARRPPAPQGHATRSARWQWGTPMSDAYPRDMRGYGRTPPEARWPDGARLALQFVINYEEGAENCNLHGDPTSEGFLSEIVGAKRLPGARNMNME